jgi:hypothetical protein
VDAFAPGKVEVVRETGSDSVRRCFRRIEKHALLYPNVVLPLFFRKDARGPAKSVKRAHQLREMETAIAMERPKKPMVLTPGQRDELEAMERSKSLPGELVTRARVILLCATGKTNHEISELMMMNSATVGKWRRRFLNLGISGLHERRTGRPRSTPSGDRKKEP